MALEIDPIEPSDLDEGDRILRLAFGTFLGMPDPAATFEDRDLFRTRWRAKNTRVLAARQDGVLVGSNVVTRWGSLGLFGPLTVRPDLWDRGIARALLEETVRIFEEWGVPHRGLFTFPQSAKHVSLYQRYGYWPHFLTPIFEKSLSPPGPPVTGSKDSKLYSQMAPAETGPLMRECAELAGAAMPGLDLSDEIRSVSDQDLGDTVLTYDGSRLDGFAICHVGAHTEAGGNCCYVKFGLVRGGSAGTERLATLLSTVESFARSRRVGRIEAGVNASHRESLQLIDRLGYRAEFIGVAMQSPDEEGYHRPDVHVIDDWR
jgi:GNAT superfamily N-acetyltransferase